MTAFQLPWSFGQFAHGGTRNWWPDRSPCWDSHRPAICLFICSYQALKAKLHIYTQNISSIEIGFFSLGSRRPAKELAIFSEWVGWRWECGQRWWKSLFKVEDSPLLGSVITVISTFLGERTLVIEFQGMGCSHRTGHDYQEGELPGKMCVV